MSVAWIIWWVVSGMPEVKLVTGWNVFGVAFIAAVAVDLVVVLYTQRQGLADLHLFGRPYDPGRGWRRDEH